MLCTFGALCEPEFGHRTAELVLRAELRIVPILSVAIVLSLQSGLPVEVEALTAATAMAIAIIEYS